MNTSVQCHQTASFVIDFLYKQHIKILIIKSKTNHILDLFTIETQLFPMALQVLHIHSYTLQNNPDSFVGSIVRNLKQTIDWIFKTATIMLSICILIQTFRCNRLHNWMEMTFIRCTIFFLVFSIFGEKEQKLNMLNNGRHTPCLSDISQPTWQDSEFRKADGHNLFVKNTPTIR